MNDSAPPVQVKFLPVRRWVRIVALGLLGLIVAVVVFINRAPQFEYLLKAQPPMCILKRATGIPCLGCRGTRAAFAFAHGNLGEALAWNPFAFTLGIGILGWTLSAGLAGRYPSMTFREPWGKLAIVLLIFLLIGNWAYVIQAGG